MTFLSWFFNLTWCVRLLEIVIFFRPNERIWDMEVPMYQIRLGKSLGKADG